jgi:hypothetical protein
MIFLWIYIYGSILTITLLFSIDYYSCLARQEGVVDIFEWDEETKSVKFDSEILKQIGWLLLVFVFLYPIVWFALIFDRE